MITEDKQLIDAVRTALIHDESLVPPDLTRKQVEFEVNNVRAFIMTMFPRTGQAILNYMDTLYLPDWEYGTYHNIRHVISVLQGVLDYISQYQADPRTVRLLLLAAIFHDANHTLGAMPDRVNTALAVGTLQPTQYLGASIPNWLMHMGNYWLADIECSKYTDATGFLSELMELILDTTFPYNDVCDPPYLVGVFRDIDRLTIHRIDWFDQIYSGLYLETAAPKGVTFVDFCKAQVNFLLSLHVYTLIDNGRLTIAIAKARHVLTVAQKLGGRSCIK